MIQYSELLIEINENKMGIYSEKDIHINDGFVYLQDTRIGMWWNKYDGKVCLDHCVGKSFFAQHLDELKHKLLIILNNK